MCPAYAKKTGNERKKWAKFVPARVDEVQSGTGMDFNRRNLWKGYFYRFQHAP
jgi:hypothetical protein